MTQTQTSETRTRSTALEARPVYNRLDPASDAARFARLQDAASAGKTLTQFAREEGIRFASLDKWLAARPAYAEAVAHLRRGPKAVLTQAEVEKLAVAIQHRKAGLRWKQAARLAGVDVARAQRWFYRAGGVA